ncbi:HNH endonuclease [Paenibacillus spongiae]|uniref:HNH endonuclease n=1 Tax=Paenibacillus spongiae TaxID=2909671 RepID=A0ABY5SBI7_9BACL|nr:HNH endonuclease signature motif containing protein [Paenibacillus spongiae]UVI31019.1 HNH endonuclease [Paenibacillus spongiae]
MKFISVFQMPKPVNVMGRSSSITNSFVNGIIPCIIPSEEEIRESLAILELEAEDLRCAYCGDKSTEWDHLRPLVKGKQPTGYISDIYNLVPACGKCNQSKGNKNWKEWMRSNARLSPQSRGVTDLVNKISRLEKYEKWKAVMPLNFKDLIDEELWEEHWNNYNQLIELMKRSQQTSAKVQQQLQSRYREQI